MTEMLWDTTGAFGDAVGTLGCNGDTLGHRAMRLWDRRGCCGTQRDTRMQGGHLGTQGGTLRHFGAQRRGSGMQWGYFGTQRGHFVLQRGYWGV